MRTQYRHVHESCSRDKNERIYLFAPFLTLPYICVSFNKIHRIMKDVTYKFNSKNLGRAFMKELLGLGYSNEWQATEWNDINSGMISYPENNKNGFAIYPHQLEIGENEIVFQLESQYQEAFDFAKENIKKSNGVEFEEGDWVIVNHGSINDIGKAMVKYSSCARTCGFGHVAGNGRNWTNKFSIKNAIEWDHIERKATKEEIEAALIKEAKRRGFKRGVTMKPIYGDSRPKVEIINDCDSDFKYYPEDDNLRISGGVKSSNYYGNSAITVYKDGKWAEIIEDKLEIAGYEVEDLGSKMRLGCKEIHWGDVDNFITICDRFEFQTITTNHGDVTKQELKELRKRYL